MGRDVADQDALACCEREGAIAGLADVDLRHGPDHLHLALFDGAVLEYIGAMIRSIRATDEQMWPAMPFDNL